MNKIKLLFKKYDSLSQHINCMINDTIYNVNIQKNLVYNRTKLSIVGVYDENLIIMNSGLIYNLDEDGTIKYENKIVGIWKNK